jgi:hypothetical protein
MSPRRFDQVKMECAEIAAPVDTDVPRIVLLDEHRTGFFRDQVGELTYGRLVLRRIDSIVRTPKPMRLTVLKTQATSALLLYCLNRCRWRRASQRERVCPSFLARLPRPSY